MSLIEAGIIPSKFIIELSDIGDSCHFYTNIFILTYFACQISSYALELLRFREAGVEVVLKAS